DPITNRSVNAHAFGPGEAEYVSQLQAYDAAFGKFFARLAADGITKDNTLFLIVPDGERPFRRQPAGARRMRRSERRMHLQPGLRNQCVPQSPAADAAQQHNAVFSP